MEGAGRLRFNMYVGDGERRVMGLQEWEQESQGEKGSVWLGNQSKVSQRLLLNIPPQVLLMIHSGVRLYAAHSFNTDQMFQRCY